MRAARALLLVVVAVSSCSGPRIGREGSAGCAHLQSERQVRGIALCEDVWTCARPPNGSFDRVGLTRVAACDGATGPTVLYLPGMHMNGSIPFTNARHDLRLYLAQAGFRTWGLSYRTHTVPPEATAAELETLREWTARVFAEDAAWAVRFVRGAEEGPLFLAGFSYGAGLACRVASREPVAGLVILDGSAGPGLAPREGGPAIDVGSERLPFGERQQLLQQVLDDANDAADARLADILYSSAAFGGHGGLSNARGGVSDVRVLAQLLASYDRWWPRAALQTDAATPPRAPLRVLAFTSTNIGPEWIAQVRTTAETFGGAQAVVRELRGYGHLDVLVGRSAAREVFEPTRLWLEGR